MLHTTQQTRTAAPVTRRRETTLDYAVSQSPVIVYIADPAHDGCFTFVSANVEAVTGHTAAVMVADQKFRLSAMHPDDRARYRRCLQSLESARDATLEYRFQNHAGAYRWFRDHMRFNDNGACGSEVIGCMIDITDEKLAATTYRNGDARKPANDRPLHRHADHIGTQAAQPLTDLVPDADEPIKLSRAREDMEKALRESEDLVRRVLETCPVPLRMWRPADGRVIYESPASKALFGRARDAYWLRDPSDIYVDVADRARYLACLRAAGSVDDYQMQLKHADGTAFWASISARIVDFQGEEVVVSSTMDLSERRAVEEEMARQREALHQSEKLSALGSLLAGVAHELNNPLSVVVGQALLLEETAGDEGTAKRAAKIGTAADKCARIVRTFLAMARQQPAVRTEVKINEIVEATLEVTGYSLRTAGIAVELDIDPDLPPVWADPDQLNQVVSNLIVNAQQAMSKAKGDRRLRIASVYDHQTGTVLLSVKDNGPGIPADIRSRIFEPFFTTKDVGAGTGIGLAVCHRIVEAMHGKIGVKSRPGEGATFTIALPVPRQQVPVPSSVDLPEPEASACRVLVIDDEADVTRMLNDILTSDGHDVKSAESGKQALHLLSRHEFDVILSDLRMPNMDGPRLFETLKALSPKLVSRVAFITGDTFSPSVSQFFRDAGRPHVQKPFSPNEVRQLVVKVLANQHVDAVMA